MNKLSPADLLTLCTEQHLLSGSQLDSLAERLASPEADATEAVEKMRRDGVLTEFQARQVLDGGGAGLTLGQYALVELLGEGGMGQVFKARHRMMRRIVALKVIRPEQGTQEKALKRFLREIQAMSQLTHPNIVIAFDAGQTDDRIYLVMEYVAGKDLAKLVKDRGPFPVGEACECVRQAALGLQHAHEEGLVHRDIKPSNILVDGKGVVKVLDLGLARTQRAADDASAATEDGDHLTKTGVVMGTPDFMAPEQARDASRVDIRADLYALGCTLFYLLTGRMAFSGTTFMEKLAQHAFDPPPPVEQYRRDVPPEVSAIIAKLLAKNPDDRYATPQQLADALAPYSRPIQTSGTVPVAVAYRGDVQSVERTEGSAAQESFERTQTQARPALPPRQATQVSLVERTAEQAPPPADPRRAATAPVTVVPEPPSAEPAQSLTAPTRPRRSFAPVAAGGLVVGLAVAAGLAYQQGFFKPPATTLASVSPVPPEPVKVVPPPEKKADPPAVARVDPPPPPPKVVPKTDPEPKATPKVDPPPKVLPRPDPEPKKAPDPPKADPAPPDPPKVVPQEVAKPTFRGLLDNHQGQVTGVAVAAADGGLRAATCGMDYRVLLWDVKAFKPTKNLATQFLDELPWAVALSAGGRQVLVAHGGQTLQGSPNKIFPSKNNTVNCWDVPAGTEQRYDYHKADVKAVAWAVGDTVFASAGADGKVCVWELDQPQRPLAVYDGHGKSPVSCVAFSADGRRGASGGRDGKVHVWDAGTGRPVQKLDGHATTVTGVAFTADGRLLSSGLDGTVRVWNLRAGSEVGRYDGHAGKPVWSLAVTPDGGRAVSGGEGGELHVWSPADGRAQFPPVALANARAVKAVALSRDGTTALAAADKLVHVYELPRP